MAGEDPNPFLNRSAPSADPAELISDDEATVEFTTRNPIRMHTGPDFEPATDIEYGARPARGKGSRGDGDRATSGSDEDDLHEPTLVDLDRDSVLSNTGPAATPARTRRIHWGRWVLVGLIVLALVTAIGAVIAETYTRRVATQRIQEALSSGFNTAATATIVDPVVLAALFSGTINQIDFTAPDASIKTSTEPVRFRSITGSARDISDPTDPDKATIRDLSGQAVMGWAELSRLAGTELRYEPTGKVRVDRTVEILGADVKVQIIATPRVDPVTRRVILENPEAKASAIPVPASLLSAALENFADRLVLPELPGLDYRTLVSTPEGAKVSVAGSNVKLSELRR